MKLKVPINDGGAPGSVNSTASKLIEIDSRPGNNNRHGPHVSYVKGYTSGEYQENNIGWWYSGKRFTLDRGHLEESTKLSVDWSTVVGFLDTW